MEATKSDILREADFHVPRDLALGLVGWCYQQIQAIVNICFDVPQSFHGVSRTKRVTSHLFLRPSPKSTRSTEDASFCE